jgi:hypothetical protein
MDPIEPDKQDARDPDDAADDHIERGEPDKDDGGVDAGEPDGSGSRGLTRRQEKALEALLNEPTVARAAQLAGVGERTLHSWLRQPVFAAAYRESRRTAFGHAISLTQKYSPMAVGTLVKIMGDEGKPATARVAAATALLRFGREAIELDDLVERLARLEARADSDAGDDVPPRRWKR